VASILLLAGVILERAALTTGFLAASIAVGGFLARALAVRWATEPPELQRPTATGGLLGFAIAIVVIVVDAIVG
jgi:hypothetical protein